MSAGCGWSAQLGKADAKGPKSQRLSVVVVDISQCICKQRKKGHEKEQGLGLALLEHENFGLMMVGDSGVPALLHSVCQCKASPKA